MAIDINYYLRIQNRYDCNEAQAKKYEIKNILNNDFAKTLDCYSVIINDSEEPQDLTIIKTSNLDIKKIKSRPNEVFYSGDVVSWMNTHWLIEDVDANNDIITYGKMQECNYKLKWQNESGSIIESWIVIQSANKYSNGEEGNKTITIGNDQLMLFIPYNVESIKLRRGKKFFIDNNTANPTPYKLTRIDGATYVKNGHGYLCCIVTETQSNSDTDRPELMLCDYIPLSEDIQESDTSYIKISYPGSDMIYIGGNSKTFKATLYNKNNVEQTITPVWEITPDTGLTIVTDGSSCTISCSDCDLDGDVISVKVTDSITDTTATVDITLTAI